MTSVLVRFGAIACLLAPILAACGTDVQDTYPAPQERHPEQSGGYSGPSEQSDSIFGPGGIFGSSKDKNQNGGGGGIGVNAYLWRATLDTISFLPLTSADPFGGVIITDWYQPPDAPNERLKLTIVILDRQLRADGIRVSVFRQTRESDGNWVDAKVDPKTARQMEDAILARARELRIADTNKS